ncbi:MAG: peptidylprolyl isomerase [Mesorhizobium sp.]|jgi:peptidyl-prolyl cis-trans isomerase C
MPVSFPRAVLVCCGLAAGALLLPVGIAGAQQDKVVATIDGKNITEADLERAATDLAPQFGQLPEEQRRAAALSALIEMRVLGAKAEADGIDKTPDFQSQMEFLRLRALHSALVQSEVASKLTDDQIRALYDAQVASTPPANEVHGRHILVKSKEEADAIIKQLDGGADFQKLANEHTSDPSGKTTGGDLGYFGPGQMVPEFDKVAFELEVGTYTKQPVQTQFGWHVIKVEDKRAQQPPAFDQVKDQFRSMLLREKYLELVKSLRGAAKVEISDPELKTAVEQIEKPK